MRDDLGWSIEYDAAGNFVRADCQHSWLDNPHVTVTRVKDDHVLIEISTDTVDDFGYAGPTQSASIPAYVLMAATQGQVFTRYWR